MATVSELEEKSRQLAKVLAESCMVRDAYDVRSLDQETAAQRIEQALLAERRLARIGAFEESAKIARLYQTAVAPTTRAAERIECLILERAAAEKEVGTK